MLSSFDRRIQKVLVRNNLISKEKLQDIIQNNGKQADKSLADTLLDEQLLTQEELLSSIAKDLDIPPIRLERVTPSQEALDLMTAEMARHYTAIPVSKIRNLVTMAVANPFDLQTLDDLERLTSCKIRTVVAPEKTITRTIEKCYGDSKEEIEQLFESSGDQTELEFQQEQEEETVDLSDLASTAEDSKVVRLVNMIIRKGLKEGASDVHIEPYEFKTRVRYRKDGILHTELTPPKSLHAALVSRIKIMSQLDIAERRIPQDGKFKMQFEGRQIDFRVSTLPTVHGEKVVMRLLDSAGLALDLDDLGFEDSSLKSFRKAIHEPWGMILVTGPTGSGKSTTLYSSIQEVMSPSENIVTVEDPVEYQLDGIVQTQVETKQGLTFAKALRAILRQDPDTVLIGEIRDQETAEIALEAALTGHLVLSTLHTNDAPSAIPRLIDMGTDPFMVGSSLNLVSAQRLLRELCEECKRPMEDPPSEDYLLEVGFTQEEIDKDLTLYEPVGCNQCTGGYDGRFAVLETMEVNEQLQRKIVDGATANDLKHYALEELGMLTLRRGALLNVMRGKTSLEEAVRITMAD